MPHQPLVVQEATFVIDVLNELIIGCMKYMIQPTCSPVHNVVLFMAFRGYFSETS